MPRPRLHLIRLPGVLAPNAKLRALVVPPGPAEDELLLGDVSVVVNGEAEAEQAQPIASNGRQHRFQAN
jgi:hypothetical protein